MAKYFDNVEYDVGIKSYTSSSSSPCNVNEGFTAVLKARYSDFIVHEVDLHGTMAVLDCLEDHPLNSNNGTITNENCNTAEKKEVKEEIKDERIIDDCNNTPDRKKRKLQDGDEEKMSTEMIDSVHHQNDGKGQKHMDEKDDSCEKCKNDVGDNEGGDLKTDPRHKDLENALKELSQIGVAPAISQSAMDMLKYWLDKPKKEMGEENKDNFFLFPIIEEKAIRTKIHQLIKGPFLQKYALADTKDGKIRLWPKQFKKDVRDNYHGNKRKKAFQKWPQDRPNYLKFVLYKENLDTNTALKDIQRYSKISNPAKTRINVAGMKDKRGITSQFCTVYQQEPKAFLHLNRYRSGSGGGTTSHSGSSFLRVGNFSYVDEDLRLGRLSGNRFDVALRNIQFQSSDTNKSTSSSTNNNDNSSNNDNAHSNIDEKADSFEAIKSKLQAAAQSFQSIGFINYFGMQRFGKNQDTHKVGIEILKGNFEEAVDIIMSVKPDEEERFTKVKTQWMNRFHDIEQPRSEENKSTNNNNDNDNDNDKKINHSIDFNTKNKEIEETKRQAEAKCAKKIGNELGRFMMCEVSLMRSLARRPRDYKAAFRTIMRNTQLMFLHAVQSFIWNKAASYRIETGGNTHVLVGDLVLIENKSKSEGGSGTSGLLGKTVKVVTAEDIATGTFAITDVVLPLPGSKVKYPSNDTGTFYDSLLKELGLNKDNWIQSNRELSLGGDYRNIICKPIDVSYEVKQYTDPKEPLMRTDLMKLQGVELTTTTDNDVKNEFEGENDSSKIEKKETLLGMVIGFTLPPSSYATIALRDLMKCPTSSRYQSKLSLGGNSM